VECFPEKPAPASELPAPDDGYGIERGAIAASPAYIGGLDWPRVQTILEAETARLPAPAVISTDDIPSYGQAVFGYPPILRPLDDVRWLALWYNETQALTVGGKTVRGKVIILYSTYGEAKETAIYVGTPDEKWYGARRAGSCDELMAWSAYFRAWSSLGPP